MRNQFINTPLYLPSGSSRRLVKPTARFGGRIEYPPYQGGARGGLGKSTFGMHLVYIEKRSASQMLSGLSKDSVLAEVVQVVEAKTIQIINEAKHIEGSSQQGR